MAIFCSNSQNNVNLRVIEIKYLKRICRKLNESLSCLSFPFGFCIIRSGLHYSSADGNSHYYYYYCLTNLALKSFRTYATEQMRLESFSKAFNSHSRSDLWGKSIPFSWASNRESSISSALQSTRRHDELRR